MQRLEPETTALIVIDVQERLAAAMPPPQLEALARSAGVLLAAARVLGVPVLATEQYPKGLGATLPDLAPKLEAAGATRFEKLTFSACDAEGFVTRLAESRVGRRC
jgi:nicotinamidase-related amidase